jgi:hypothetical protein
MTSFSMRDRALFFLWRNGSHWTTNGERIYSALYSTIMHISLDLDIVGLGNPSVEISTDPVG